MGGIWLDKCVKTPYPMYFLPFKLSDFVVIMLINVKMLINVGILTFKSMINFMFFGFRINIYIEKCESFPQ